MISQRADAIDWELQYDTGVFCKPDIARCDAYGEACAYFEENPEHDTVSFDSVIDTVFP